MPDKEQELINLIRKMIEEGESLEGIKQTLRASGISENMIHDLIQKAGVKPTVEDLHKKVETISKQVEKVTPLTEINIEQRKKLEELSKQLASLQAGALEHAEKITQVNEKLQEQHEKLLELAKEIKEIKQKPQQTTPTYSTQDIKQIKEMLIEMKPEIEAVKNLLEKLIDINKKMLLKLGKK